MALRNTPLDNLCPSLLGFHSSFLPGWMKKGALESRQEKLLLAPRSPPAPSPTQVHLRTSVMGRGMALTFHSCCSSRYSLDPVVSPASLFPIVRWGQDSPSMRQSPSPQPDVGKYPPGLSHLESTKALSGWRFPAPSLIPGPQSTGHTRDGSPVEAVPVPLLREGCFGGMM